MDHEGEARVEVEVGSITPRREISVATVVVVEGNPNLFQVVLTTHPRSSLADLLYGWEQQANEDRDDRDDHEELDKREAEPSRTGT